MIYLYILYSEKADQYYVGHTADLEDRLHRHNEGKSRATSKGVPWQVKVSIPFESRSAAMSAERWVKRMKSRRVIEEVISGEIDLPDRTQNSMC
ncbi:MAG: GIY-YIG nuclease family protein [Balneolaceae bacterium]